MKLHLKRTHIIETLRVWRVTRERIYISEEVAAMEEHRHRHQHHHHRRRHLSEAEVPIATSSMGAKIVVVAALIAIMAVRRPSMDPVSVRGINHQAEFWIWVTRRYVYSDATAKNLAA